MRNAMTIACKPARPRTRAPGSAARNTRHTLCALAALLALAGATPALAVGARVDVSVIDRDSGATLPVYWHQGQAWVAGRPGARYAVALTNRGGARVLTVLSVDGVNAISGETASWEQTGYVLGPYQRSAITGWRKSADEVAAFHFTALPRSYAARTGRPENVGVIGVAVFSERQLRPPRWERPLPTPRPRLDGIGAAPAAAESAERMDSAADAAAGKPQARAPRPSGEAAVSAAPSLGTGHGARESSPVSDTVFERRSSRPDETITIRYDSLEALIARGIVTRTPQPGTPQAFPAAPENRYVPDPPLGR